MNNIEKQNSSMVDDKTILKNKVGRRKSAIADVKMIPGSGNMKINKLKDNIYFQNQALFISKIWAPLKKLAVETKFDIFIHVYGGGISAQADAIQLAIAKILDQIFFNDSIKSKLLRINLGLVNNSNTKITRILFKNENYLTTDSRVKERRKYGFKKARKSSQFSKR